MASANRPDPDTLRGTTLKVYRYLFKLGEPAGIRDIQRALGLSSSSVAEYHVKKLLQSGLIKEDHEGYAVDRIVWQNMVRMRRTVIPFQAFFVVLFAGFWSLVNLQDEGPRCLGGCAPSLLQYYQTVYVSSSILVALGMAGAFFGVRLMVR